MVHSWFTIMSQIRKRDERFPLNESEVVEYEQPAMPTNSDYSVEGAMRQVNTLFPGQEDFFKDKEFDIIK